MQLRYTQKIENFEIWIRDLTEDEIDYLHTPFNEVKINKIGKDKAEQCVIEANIMIEEIGSFYVTNRLRNEIQLRKSQHRDQQIDSILND